MKISALDVLHLEAPDFNGRIYDSSWSTCIVRVHTDAGITGLGEADSVPAVVRSIIETPAYHSRAMGLSAAVMGCDPLDPVAVWDRMYDATYLYGRRGAVIHAMSAIDLALWDIKGKAEGKSAASLPGGREPRQRIQAYGTVFPPGTTAGEIATTLDAALATGLRALNICAEPDWRFDLDKAANAVRTARAHVGPDVKLILDAVGVWNAAAEVLPLVPVLVEAAFEWLEAPFPLEQLSEYALLAHAGIAIGGGDLGMTTRHEYAQMVEEGGAHILQPDLSMAGGLTDGRRIAELARNHGRRVVLHGYKTNVLYAANIAFLAQHWQDEMLEYSLSTSPLIRAVTHETSEIQSDGTVLVPTAPGLGITLNEQALACFRT